MSENPNAGLARRTLKNSLFGMIEFGWPVLVALVASPYIVRTLGDSAYGLLSIVGVTMGLFGFLDLGVGGAAILRVSALHQQGDVEGINEVLSVVLAFYMGVGVLGAVLILATTNFLVGHVLHVPLGLANAARLAFYISAPALAAAFTLSALSSIPKAIQRYDISTKISIATATANTAVTLGLLWAGEGVLAVVAAGLLISLVSLPIYYVVAKRLLPSLRLRPHFDPVIIRELFTFGGYFLVSSLGVLLLYQADKLLLGALVSTAAVTYYVVPGNLTQKIQGLIAAMTSVVFPVSSALFAADEHDTLIHLYREGVRMVSIAAIAMTVPLAVFARPFLTFWMPHLASKSTLPMILLAGTYGILSLSSIPWGIANGSGRAKINALFTLAIAALDIGMFLVLVPRYGVTGAAFSYLISAVVGVPILIAYIEHNILGLSGFEFMAIISKTALVGVIQLAISAVLRLAAVNLMSTLVLMVLAVLTFPLIYWALGFPTKGDKRIIRMLVERFVA